MMPVLFYERMVGYVLRKAAGLPIRERDLRSAFQTSNVNPVILSMADRVAARLMEHRGGVIRCRLCGRTFKSKTGAFHHLLRIHYRDALDMVKNEIRGFLQRHGVRMKDRELDYMRYSQLKRIILNLNRVGGVGGALPV